GLPCVAARLRPSTHVTFSLRFRSPSRSPGPVAGRSVRPKSAWWSQIRPRRRLAGNGLENRFRGFSSDEGSNPSPSVFSGVFASAAGLQEKFVIARPPTRPPRGRQRPSRRAFRGRFRSPAVPPKAAPRRLRGGGEARTHGLVWASAASSVDRRPDAAEQLYSVQFMRTTNALESDLTTKARIRDTAMELFGREGVAASSLRGVARAAGVSPGLIVHHFGTKEGLIRAVDEAALTRINLA